MSRFIVIDGGDGAGKTTVMDGIGREFPKLLQTHEPGGTQIAREIRKLLLDPMSKDQDPIRMMLLFFAARRDLMINLVQPAFVQGKSIVSDRFDTSTFAYQVYGSDNPQIWELFRSLRRIVVGELEPFYIFLDVDTDVARARLSARDSEGNHFDQDSRDKHVRRRQAYHAFVGEFSISEDQYRFVDANQEPEKVLADVVQIIKPLLE